MVMSPFGSNNSFLKALIIARHIVVESKVVLVLGLIGLRSIVPPLFFRHLLWSELFSLPVLLSKAHWGVWENATKCQFLEKLTTYFELYLCWRCSQDNSRFLFSFFLQKSVLFLSVIIRMTYEEFVLHRNLGSPDIFSFVSQLSIWFAFDSVVVIFFKNASSGLILFLEKFGLISYNIVIS